MVQRLITCKKTQEPIGLEAIKYKLSSHAMSDKCRLLFGNLVHYMISMPETRQSDCNSEMTSR